MWKCNKVAQKMWSTVQNYVFDVEISMNSQENQFTKKCNCMLKLSTQLGQFQIDFF